MHSIQLTDEQREELLFVISRHLNLPENEARDLHNALIHGNIWREWLLEGAHIITTMTSSASA